MDSIKLILSEPNYTSDEVNSQNGNQKIFSPPEIDCIILDVGNTGKLLHRLLNYGNQ